MTIVKCHECAKEISTEAKRCPHCGVSSLIYAGTKPVLRKHTTIVGVILCVANFGVVFAMLGGVVTTPVGIGLLIFSWVLYTPLSKALASVW